MERIYELEDKMRAVECDMAAVNENIESLEEKNDHINNRISELSKEKVEVNAEDIEVLRFTDIRTVEHAKICLSTFFGLLLDLNVYKKQLEKKAVEQETTIETLRVENASLSADRDSREAQFQLELEKLATDFAKRTELISRELNEFQALNAPDPEPPVVPIEQP